MTVSSRDQPSSYATARAAVPALLDTLAGFAPRAEPITEREYLSRVLEFTAWDGESASDLATLERPILLGGTLIERMNRAPTASPNVSEPVRAEVLTERALFLRDMFRRHLTDAMAGVQRWDFGKHIYRNMLILPARVHEQDVASALAVFLPRDLFTAIEYSLALLFDEERGFADFLRKCELKTCGGFFLRSDKGGKPAKYHDACRARLRAKSRHLRRKTKESRR